MNQNELISALETTPVETIKKMYFSGSFNEGKFYDLTSQNIEFIERAVIYRIGNRERINCKCGSLHGYVEEFDYDGNIIQNTVCMCCSTVVDVNRVSGDIDVNEDQLLNLLGRF